MLYNAFHYLPSNCIDIAEFVLNFFDDAQQLGTRFLCGAAKLNAMKHGELCMKGDIPIVFLREPIKVSKPSSKSEAIPEEPCESQNTSVLDDAAGASTSASVEEDPFGPSSTPAPVPEATFPIGVKHPLNKILDDLLPLFQAYYYVHRPTNEPWVAPKKKTRGQEQDDRRRKRWGALPVTQSTSADYTPADFARKAALLENHEEFGRILFTYLDTEDWPENDKQPDQVDTKYRPKDDTLKRSQLHDGGFEMPSGKRPATGTSASRT